jgi:hypothetical protein
LVPIKTSQCETYQRKLAAAFPAVRLIHHIPLEVHLQSPIMELDQMGTEVGPVVFETSPGEGQK